MAHASRMPFACQQANWAFCSVVPRSLYEYNLKQDYNPVFRPKFNLFSNVFTNEIRIDTLSRCQPKQSSRSFMDFTTHAVRCIWLGIGISMLAYRILFSSLFDVFGDLRVVSVFCCFFLSPVTTLWFAFSGGIVKIINQWKFSESVTFIQMARTLN